MVDVMDVVDVVDVDVVDAGKCSIELGGEFSRSEHKKATFSPPSPKTALITLLVIKKK